MTPKEALKNLDTPKGRWGKILATTPIVMTVLATVFAGLSSSEMTQAMFHRSLASQQQSKAGDQWAFFQAKRIRGTTLESNIELLQTLGHAEPIQWKTLADAASKVSEAIASSSLTAPEKEQVQAELKVVREKLALLADPEMEKHRGLLAGGPLPAIDIPRLQDDSAQKLLDAAIEGIFLKKPEEDIYQLVKVLPPAVIDEAIHKADRASDQFSHNCDPTEKFCKQVREWVYSADRVIYLLDDSIAPSRPLLKLGRQLAGVRAALSNFDARRYRQESFYNQKIAQLFELRVWRSGMESDRHRIRSQLFFYSMLVAQVGVTISSLALAQARRSALWFVAAVAGIVALAFSAWVYLSR